MFTSSAVSMTGLVTLLWSSLLYIVLMCFENESLSLVESDLFLWDSILLLTFNND